MIYRMKELWDEVAFRFSVCAVIFSASHYIELLNKPSNTHPINTTAGLFSITAFCPEDIDLLALFIDFKYKAPL